MTKNDKNVLNFVEVEVTGFQICGKLKNLEDENKKLKANNKILGDELTYFKELCADLEEKINDLQKSDCNMCEVCVNCQSMAVIQGDPFLIAELAAEEQAEVVSAMGSFLGDDF